MKLHQSCGISILLAMLSLAPWMPIQQATAQATAQEKGMETLTHGPVHEAFADVISYDPKPGIIIDKAPPEMIEELPPDQKPKGENIAWIPGYWAWDDDTNDFLWVSGVWRNLPPGREWEPGYWSEVSNGYQWTSGYWRDTTVTEVSYLPEPPASIESGPNVAAPADNSIWVPGNWMWHEDRYAWRPGYWQPGQENWSWSPARYVWTPRGYLFVDGYWDYAIPNRGVLFAPVYYRNNYYANPGYYYTPSTVISLSIFSSHLFLRPSYCHYYFGDYYAPRYRNHGYWNCYDYARNRRGYDPIYAYDRWRYRNDRGWDRRRVEQYEYYRDHENARPPRTLADLQNLPDRGDRERRRDRIATSLNEYVKNPEGGQTFQPISKERRDQIVEQRREVRRFEDNRRQREARVNRADAADTAKRADIEKVPVGKSPIIGAAAANLAKGEAPPARPKPQKLQPAREPGDTSRHDDQPQKPRDIDRDERRGQRSKDEARTTEEEKRITPQERPRPQPREEQVKPREESRPTPKEERRVQPKEEQRPQPRTERKVEPKPQPTPKAERRPQPKAEQRVTPKERTQQQPQAERRSPPKAELRPAPSTSRQTPRADSGKQQSRTEKDKNRRNE